MAPVPELASEDKADEVPFDGTAEEAAFDCLLYSLRPVPLTSTTVLGGAEEAVAVEEMVAGCELITDGATVDGPLDGGLLYSLRPVPLPVTFCETVDDGGAMVPLLETDTLT